MASIRLNTIIVDNKILSIINGSVQISNTDISQNSNSGALTVKGGIGIYCTSDAISSINGGALTLNGGFGVKGKSFLGSDLILDSALSLFTIEGVACPRLFLDSIENKQFFLSLDGINKHLSLTSSQLLLNVTQSSHSITEGALVINGGLSLNTNINSSSVTCGGGITIGGGGSVYGDFYIGESLFVSGGGIYTSNIYSPTFLKIQTNDDIEIIGSNININYDLLNFNNNIQLSNDVLINIPVICNQNVLMKNNVIMENHLTIMKNLNVLTDLNINGNISVSKNLNIGNENTYISNYNNYITLNSNKGYIFESTSSSVSIYSGILNLNDYSFFNDNDFNLNIISAYSKSCINTFSNLDDNLICLYSYHKNNHDQDQDQDQDHDHDHDHDHDQVYDNSEFIKLGYDSSKKINILSIETTGDGEIKDFVLKNKNGNLILRTDGSLYNDCPKVSLNSTTASFVFNGGVSINCDLNSMSTTEGGSLTLNGGLSILKDIYIGGEINLNGKLNVSDKINVSFSNGVNMNLFNATQTNELSIGIYSLGTSLNDTDFECINLSKNKGFSISSLSSGIGELQSIQIYTGNTHNQLFISTNGNIGINNDSPQYSLDVNGNINGNYFFAKDISIENDLNCFSALIKNLRLTNDLDVQNNVSIQNNMFINGIVYCKNQEENSFIIDGGIKISKNMNISGNIKSESSGTFDDLFINNTKSNAITCDGGIKINCSFNSESITHGGALTVLGGTSIHGDTFIGGSCNLYNTFNLKNCNLNKNILTVNDSYNILRFSMNYNNNNLSISRHDLNSEIIEEVITIINTSGSTFFNNTTPSINNTLGSVVMMGGLSINCVNNVLNISQGGCLTVAGGASISKNMMIGGNVTILSTSQSNNIGSGALIVHGGLGVNSNVNIGGNTIINGDLIVNGNTTNISTENTSIKDNIFVLNSGPSGSHDSGFIIERYQTNNDKGKGDVVNDNPYIIDRLTNQNDIISPSNEIKLSYLTSNVDNYYKNWWIKIDSGFSANQVRQVIGYNGTTHIATLSTPWTNQNPANGDIAHLFNKPYVGMIFNERLGLFEFGSTVQDPNSSNIMFTDNIGLLFNNGLCLDTSPSTSSTFGALVLSGGGLSINCTEDAKNNTCGGSLTVAGGASINKSLHIGNDLYINNVKMTPNVSDIFSSVTFTAMNNQLDIPCIIIDKSVLSFDIFLGIVVEMVDPIDNLYCNFNIRGVNKQLSWDIVTSFIGEDTGIEFDIIIDNLTSNGILIYSTPDYGTDISNIKFKYKMITN